MVAVTAVTVVDVVVYSLSSLSFVVAVVAILAVSANLSQLMNMHCFQYIFKTKKKREHEVLSFYFLSFIRYRNKFLS